MLKKNSFLEEIKKNRIMFFMITPAILFFFIFSYLPIVGIYYAFTRFNFSGGLFGSPFIGLDNFKFLINSNLIFKLTFNTISYNLVFIITSSFFQILIAILLSELSGKFFKKLTQSIMFLPYFVSYVLIGVFVYAAFNYETGMVNSILRSMDIDRFDAYNAPWIWKYIIVATYNWKWIGYGTVIYLAVITGINNEYYEAARIDGANIFQQIFKITIPLLTPTFVILLLFSLGMIMRGQFELFYQIVGQNGVLFNATDILDTYVFRSLRVNFDIGMGTAAGLYQSLFGFFVIITTNKLIKRKHEEYALF